MGYELHFGLGKIKNNHTKEIKLIQSFESIDRFSIKELGEIKRIDCIISDEQHYEVRLIDLDTLFILRSAVNKMMQELMEYKIKSIQESSLDASYGSAEFGTASLDKLEKAHQQLTQMIEYWCDEIETCIASYPEYDYALALKTFNRFKLTAFAYMT